MEKYFLPHSIDIDLKDPNEFESISDWLESCGLKKINCKFHAAKISKMVQLVQLKYKRLNFKESFEGRRGRRGKKSLPPKTGGEEEQSGLLGLLLHQARYLSTTLQLRIIDNNFTIIIFAKTTDDIYQNLYTTGQA